MKARIKLDVRSFKSPQDSLRSQFVLQFWRCNDWTIQLGVFDGNDVLDVSDFDTIYLSIRELVDNKPPSGGEPALILKSTSDIDATMTAQTWERGTEQNAELSFAYDETSLNAGMYWLSIWAVTETNETITLGAGVCKINENGGISTVPPDPIVMYYTADEINNLLVDYAPREDVEEAFSSYYTKDETDNAISTEVENALSGYYTSSETDDAIDGALSEYYTSAETDNVIDDNVGSALTDYYTKDEADSRFEPRGSGGSLDNYYTKEETDSAISTFVGSSLEDYYDKDETNSAISAEVESSLDGYYTGSETDSAISTALGGYYTSTATDNAISVALSTSLSNYYTGSETDSAISAEVGSALTGYYTGSQTDSAINAEVTSALSNYYTKAQADSRFEPISGGSGGGGGVSPTSKGTIAIGDGSSTQILAAGTENQVLVADPSAEYGAKWSDYPWKEIASYEITESTNTIDFENVFDSTKYDQYKIVFKFLRPDPVHARLLMQYGYDNEGTTTWIDDLNEYNFSVADLAGTVAHYESYKWTTGYFLFGSASTSYRNNGGDLYGEIDIWNDGSTSNWIHAKGQITSYRIYNGNLISVNGIHSFFFKNEGQYSVNSVRFKSYALDSEGDPPPEISSVFTKGKIIVYGFSKQVNVSSVSVPVASVSSNSSINPTEKGTIAIGDGTNTQILAAGTENQLLIADPSATYGAKWGNYPWKLLARYSVTDSIAEIPFENVFNPSLTDHYKIIFKFIRLSVVSSRLEMQYGYDNEGTTTWIDDMSEYNFSVADLAGTVAHYESYKWTTGYFLFGSESTSYRNNGGDLYGEIDIWNDGSTSNWIHAKGQITSYRIYNGNLISVNGIHSFFFKNEGQYSVNSVKFMLESGLFDAGQFLVYALSY